jgi:hypothetical protein
MLVPAIALIVVLFFVVRFIVGAAKKKSQGEDLGDSRAGAPIHQSSNTGRVG